MYYSTLSALASTTPPSISVPRDQTKATHCFNHHLILLPPLPCLFLLHDILLSSHDRCTDPTQSVPLPDCPVFPTKIPSHLVLPLPLTLSSIQRVTLPGLSGCCTLFITRRREKIFSPFFFIIFDILVF